MAIFVPDPNLKLLLTTEIQSILKHQGEKLFINMSDHTKKIMINVTLLRDISVETK